MEKRKYFAVAASAAVALSAVFSPLTTYAQDEEVNLEEELDEDITSQPDNSEDENATDENQPDEEDPVLLTDLGSIEIHNYDGKLPEGIRVNITEVDIEEDQNPYTGKVSKGYLIELLDKEGNTFIPDDDSVEYILHLRIPNEFMGDQLFLNCMEDQKDDPEKMEYELTPDQDEVIIHTDHLTQMFILTDQEKDLNSENVVEEDEVGTIYKSKDGDLRYRYFLGNQNQELKMTYEHLENNDYASIMEKEGVKDFKAFNVRLLNKNGKDYKPSWSTYYDFRVPIPMEYLNRNIVVYRIYGPGEHKIVTSNGIKWISSNTSFAAEIDSSIHYLNDTVDWRANSLGTYVIAAKEPVEYLKPSITKGEDYLISKTKVGEVHVENFISEPPIGVYANLIKIQRNSKEVAYLSTLLDDFNEEYEPEGDEINYTIRLRIPQELIGHKLKLHMEESYSFSSGDTHSSGLKCLPVDFELSADGTELVMHPETLNRTFVLTDLEEDKPDDDKKDPVNPAPGDPDKSDAENKPNQSDSPNEYPNTVVDETGITYKSTTGNIRVSGFNEQLPKNLKVVYKSEDSHQYDSKMEKEEITDFRAFNVDLLKDNKSYRVNGTNVKYQFEIPLPDEYKNRDVGVYRIYGPGTYRFQSGTGYSLISSGTSFAREIASSVNRKKNTVLWESDELGTYILANKGATADLNPVVTEDGEALIYKTDAGSIKIEKYGSKPPEGVHATLAKTSEKEKEDGNEKELSYSIKLLDDNNQPYTPEGENSKYTVSLKLPSELIGWDLKMNQVEIIPSIKPGNMSIIKHSYPVSFDLSKDGTELIMEPDSLDKTFELTAIKPKESNKPADTVLPTGPGTVIEPSGNMPNKPSDPEKPGEPGKPGKPSEPEEPTYYLNYNDVNYGSASAGPLKSNFGKNIFIVLDRADKNFEPYPGKKSIAVSVKVLDKNNKEYMLSEKDFKDPKKMEYSVTLLTPKEFLGHEIRIDMVEPGKGTNGNTVYTPVKYEEVRGGRSLTFSPSSLNKTFVITDMDSKADKNPSGTINTGTTPNRPNTSVNNSATSSTVTTSTRGVFYGIDGGYIRVSSLSNQPPKGLKFSYESKTGSKFSSAMKENGITEFKAYDVRLLDAAGKDYKTDEKNPRYEFNMPLPESYKKRDVGVYRIYEPGTYTFGSAGQYTTITSSTSFAREIGSSVNRVDDTIHWEADQLGTYILADKGETNDLYPTVAKDDKGITYGTNAGEIRIEGFSSEPPEGVHASLVKLKETTDAKAGEKSAFYSIKLLSERNRTFVPNGKDLKYTVRLKLPADFIGHNLRLATEETKEYGSGASAYSTTTYTPVEYMFSSDKTEIIFEPESLDKTFVLTDKEAKIEDKKNPDNELEEKSGSGSDDSGTTTTTTNSTTTKTTTQRTSSPNTGLQQRFGFWFAGLFASTAGLAVLMKKKREND